MSVQLDTDSFDDATLILEQSEAQLSLICMLYANEPHILEPSNHIVFAALQGIRDSIGRAKEMLSDGMEKAAA